MVLGASLIEQTRGFSLHWFMFRINNAKSHKHGSFWHGSPGRNNLLALDFYFLTVIFIFDCIDSSLFCILMVMISISVEV